MADNDGGPFWTPERYKEEVERVEDELGNIPPDQQLGYLKGRIAGFPQPYRGAAEIILVRGIEIMARAENQAPTGPLAFLKEAIQAVPAVKYALGVGGVVSLVAIVEGFGISKRAAIIGFPVILISMVLLLVFAKLASAKPEYFLYPLIVLTWFSIFAMISIVALVFTGVFFKWPLDLHYWLTKG